MVSVTLFQTFLQNLCVNIIVAGQANLGKANNLKVLVLRACSTSDEYLILFSQYFVLIKVLSDQLL